MRRIEAFGSAWEHGHSPNSVMPQRAIDAVTKVDPLAARWDWPFEHVDLFKDDLPSGDLASDPFRDNYRNR